MAKTAILSPHLDDAIFSCWHLIKQPGAEVITIFAGIPPKKTSTLWDRICGEANAAAMMHKRLKENENALKDTNTTYRNLNYLDAQYRPTSRRNIAEIATTIIAQVSSETQFLAPLAGGRLWRHADHITARKVGEYLLSQGRDVTFYADIPYMPMPTLASGNYINKLKKRATKLIGTKFSIEVYELSRQEQTLKLAAMLKYESQYKMTNLLSLGRLKRRANLEREIVLSPI